MYAYPTMEDAREAWPTVKAAITGNPADMQTSVKAGYVLIGFGASLYPGEPGVFGQARESVVSEAPDGYGQEQMVADLDHAFSENFGAAEGEPMNLALPWDVILPLLFQVLQNWLKK